MLDFLYHMDAALLRFFNQSCANPLADQLAQWFRSPWFWAPVYLFMLVYALRAHGMRGLWWCAFFLATFLFCDYLSASVVKTLVQRIRPCRADGLAIRELVICGSGFSFPSTHATNHFGFATFITLTLRIFFPRVAWWAYGWALLVCLSQLYCGVHYPSDILGGALMGTLLGLWNARYFLRRIGWGVQYEAL